MDAKKIELPKRFFPFVWHFLREIKIVVVVFVLLTIAAGFWGPFNSILVKNVINNLPEVHNGNISVVFTFAGLIVLNFIVFDNITWRGVMYIQAKYAPKIMGRMISQLMDYVLNHSHQFFQDNLSGTLAKQVANLSDGTERLITSVAANFIRGTSLLLTAIVTAFYVNPIFGVILSIWFACFVSASLKISKRFVALADVQAGAESGMVGELVDTLSNQSNVRVFAKRQFEKQRLQRFIGIFEQAYQNTTLYALMKHVILGGMIAVMLACSAYFLVKLYSKNLVTVGDFALIFGLVMETGHMMWFTMSEIDEFNKVIGKSRQSLTAIMKTIDISDSQNAITLQGPKGHIQLENVDFQYDGTVPLFQSLSLEIQPGEKVGLVGYSGVAKRLLLT